MGNEIGLKEKCEFLFQFYAYRAATKSSPPALEIIDPTKILDEGKGIKNKYLIRIGDVYFLISEKKNKDVKKMLKYKSYASSKLKRIFETILNPFDRTFIDFDYDLSRIQLGLDYSIVSLSRLSINSGEKRASSICNKKELPYQKFSIEDKVFYEK